MTPLEKTDNFVKIMDQAIFCVTNSSSNTAVKARTNVEYIYMARCLPFRHHFYNTYKHQVELC